MLFYQLKIEIKPYKPDEFIDSMQSILRKVRNAKGCLDFSLYRDSEKEEKYIIIGEWQTHRDMAQHFKTNEFEILVGAARVLGQTVAMNIAEVSKSGGVELAQEQIATASTTEKITM